MQVQSNFTAENDKSQTDEDTQKDSTGSEPKN